MSLLAASVLIWMMMAGGPGTVGDWVGPTKSIVRVYPCGEEVCVKIVKLPPDATQTVDLKNPDESLRKRPLCGMNIGTGFHEVSPGKLEGGHLYDPVSGKTYKGTIAADGDQLKLRGYIGVSLFGRSETWQRVAPVTACQ